MINLIPKKEEKRIIKDFYLRVLATFFMMFSFAISIINIAMLPAYIFSSERKTFISDKLEDFEINPILELSPYENEIINELDIRLDLINKNKLNDYSLTQNVIDKVISHKTEAIKIIQISYNKQVKETEILLVGIASDRESLLGFRKSFENDDSFKKVDLPISNFVKGSNIVFYLNLIPA